jgi:putative endonuclease
MTASARQILGRLGEQLALEHYQRLGYRLLDRNHRTRVGEIDLVVADQPTTVFVEVKTRSVGGLDPLFSLAPDQRLRMRRLAGAWLAEHPSRPRTAALRLDVVAVTVDRRGRLVELEQFEDVA